MAVSPPMAQCLMWWAWHQPGGRSPGGQMMQPRSRTFSAVRRWRRDDAGPNRKQIRLGTHRQRNACPQPHRPLPRARHLLPRGLDPRNQPTPPSVARTNRPEPDGSTTDSGRSVGVQSIRRDRTRHDCRDRTPHDCLAGTRHDCLNGTRHDFRACTWHRAVPENAPCPRTRVTAPRRRAPSANRNHPDAPSTPPPAPADPEPGARHTATAEKRNRQ